MRKSLSTPILLVLLAALLALPAHAVNVVADILASETWTANNEYILTKPIYVTNGATLTIEQGTVVRGEPQSIAGANDPGTLIITRGSKIRAFGTEFAPIVFTDLLDNNIGANPGTPPYDNASNAQSVTGQWGGVILLGRSYVANNTQSGPDATREIQIEGLNAPGGLGLYGNGGNDDDDSGTLSYVSIRYGGFNLSANNEINGLTLGAVGRQTNIHHIEVFQNKDDGVEFFGGTVGVQNLLAVNGGDDGVDYDEGFRGKGQFILVMQGTPGADKSDKGAEQDGGVSPDGSQPFAVPAFYNATFVGLGAQKAYTNSLNNTALVFRDNAGGRWYNSAYLDFGGGAVCIEGDPATPRTSGERAATNITSGLCRQASLAYYDPAVFCNTAATCPNGTDTCVSFFQTLGSTKQLELEDDSFWCLGNGNAIPENAGQATPLNCDNSDHYDPGVFTNAALDNNYGNCASPLPIRVLLRTPSGSATTPDPIALLDPRPTVGSSLLTTNRNAPGDGFFKPAAYRGAFGPTENWANGWSATYRLGLLPPADDIVPVTDDITTSQTWGADNEYILTKPIYVKNGATLTIEPGTVVRGEPQSIAGANDPGTLIITRGSKINAVATANDPIVFTDLLDDNHGDDRGSPPYDTASNAQSVTGQWGGVILLGRSYVANNTQSGPDATREIQIEGLTAPGGLGLYGNGGNDDDDSGSMSYVSIRYGGFNLSANNEINGLTLGAVGRLTDLDHIEVFQNKDDGVEFFGGTANIKYLIAANGGDDGVDYDEGFRGKGQFILVMQGTPGSDKSDKGAEQDGGVSPDGSQPFAMPAFYNATFVGLGAQKAYTNSLNNTALVFRDNAGGRWYNSAYLDFGGGAVCIEGDPATARTSGERAATNITSGVCRQASLAYYDPAVFCNAAATCPNGTDTCESFFATLGSTKQLELEDNSFWCLGNGNAIPENAGQATPLNCDNSDHYDPGVFTNVALDNTYGNCASALPIKTLLRTPSGVGTTPDPVASLDPRPAAGSVLLTTNRVTPVDGFFTSASYRGAFDASSNWALGWSAMSRLGLFPANQVLKNANIAASETWTANNEYILQQPIYVTNGATLTIEPGTVVRGEPQSIAGANDPGTLIITRGSKISAVGNENAPITFTDLNDSNVGDNVPAVPYDTAANAQSVTGQWGGVILLGRSYVANNTQSGPDATREIQIEGLTAPGGLGLYGNGGNDDDDSGSMSYVSVRYGGFNLSANNEINGLTLGAVGRLTDLDHIEVFQNKDDGVEFFGGTANIKYLIAANGGDDGVDYDEGFRGKGQFILVMQGTPGSDKSDKGAEQDGGVSPDGSQPFAVPAFYNATFVGLGAQKAYTNSLNNTALVFRDNAGGRWYNSAYLDFGGGAVCIEGDPATARTSGERAATNITSGLCRQASLAYYDPAVFCNAAATCPNGTDTCVSFFQTLGSTKQLELEDNSFWCLGNGNAIPENAGQATPLNCDNSDHYDPGVFTNVALENTYGNCASALPVRRLQRTPSGVGTTPDPIASLDPRPATGSGLLTTNRVAPSDGFFDVAPYRGAFPGDNWADKWTATARLGLFPHCGVNGDTTTVPHEVRNLRWASGNKSVLSWTAPIDALDDEGDLLYDTLRKRGFSGSAASTFADAECVEVDDDADLSVIDKDFPLLGEVFFYLVRAENDCGMGSLGVSTIQIRAQGATCP